jgi:hypothetical protein
MSDSVVEGKEEQEKDELDEKMMTTRHGLPKPRKRKLSSMVAL